MAMSLRLLGDFELFTGEPATRVAVPNGRATALLKLLAVRRNRIVPMESVMAALWPDEPPDTAVQVVSSLVSRLRRCIGPDLRRFEDGYRLDTGRWTVDLDEAVQLVDTSGRRLDSGQPALADAAARRAVSLLSLELLAGTQPADWLARARVEHEALIRRARHLAWRAADALGDHDRARAFAEAAIAGDSLDETAYRQLMLAHCRSGEPALALRTYARLADELAEQLGASPAPATEDLHLAILRGVKPAVHRAAPAPVVRRNRTLVGRDTILDQIEDLWHEAVAGNGRSLLVCGTAGSGRTAVLTEAVRHARATGGAVLSAACSRSTQDLPLHPIAAALRSYCSTAHPEMVRRSLTGFEDAICQLVPDLAESVLTARGPGLHPVLRRTRLVEAIVQFVARLSTEQPVLVALDDIGHADQLTLSAVATLQQRLTHAPVAVVATVEAGTPLDGFSALRTLRLEPLSRTAITELAQRAHLGHLAADVHALTGGHTRFVVDALRAAQQGATLDQLPSSLTAAALERIERAGAEVVDALAKLAALGPRFTGVDAVQLLPAGGLAQIRRALAAGLLVADDNYLAFESELLRASLYLATPTPLRPALGLTAIAGAA
jgi:DNA-binding SARP family transcriptional activator